MPERCLVGWAAMAAMFGKSSKHMRQYRDELEALGYVWFERPGLAYETVSGKKITHPMVHFFPETIKAWWHVRNRTIYREKHGLVK